MERKFIILIIAGIIAGSAVGLAGYIVTDDLQQRTNSGLTMSGLSLTPVQVRIEIVCSGNWEGNLTIGTQSAPESGFGNQNFYGTIAGLELAQASFQNTDIIAPQPITVNIYLNKMLVQSDHSNFAYTPVGVQQPSPLSSVALVMWVYEPYIFGGRPFGL